MNMKYQEFYNKYKDTKFKSENEFETTFKKCLKRNLDYRLAELPEITKWWFANVNK